MKSTKKNSQMRLIVKQLLKNKVAVVCLAVIVILVAVSLFADVLVVYDEDVIRQDIGNSLQPPSLKHFFGTDAYGRDLFCRILYGTRVTLIISVVSTAFCALLGCLLGAVSAYFGGVVDGIIMRVLDVVLAIPQVLLCIAVIATLGGGIRNLIIAITLAGVPSFARIMRSSIIGIRDSEYIESAKAIGTSAIGIILKHLIPNAIGPIIVQTTMYIGGCILTTASLSYLGLGVSAPQPEWGNILAEGQEFMRSKPYMIIIPGLAIIISSLAFNILGDSLRDALDPRLRGR